MKNVLLGLILVSILSVVAQGLTVDQVLSVNPGNLQGTVLWNQGNCHLHIYKPGERANDPSRYFVNYDLNRPPGYPLVPFPNNGSVDSWVMSQTSSDMVVYLDLPKQNFTDFEFDPTTLKIKAFRVFSSGIFVATCELN